MDERSVAGVDRPSITRCHRGLQRDRDAVLQHVAARRRHGANRPTLHEAKLELPHRVVIKAAERRPRILWDPEGVREVGGVWGGVEKRRKLYTICVRTWTAHAADVSISVGLQAHGGAIRTDMAAKGGQVDAMQLSTRVLELEVSRPLLRPPPGVLAQAARSPRVA